jgi:hypothetical protein
MLIFCSLIFLNKFKIFSDFPRPTGKYPFIRGGKLKKSNHKRRDFYLRFLIITIDKMMKSFVILFSFCLFASTPETDNSNVEDKVCLSSEEFKLYTLITQYRESQKLPPIPLSAKLSQVAKAHARDLADNYVFDPENICNPHSWSSKGKWTPCCYTSDHKQAACMWDKPREIAQYPGNGYEIAYYSSGGANAEEGIEGWKKSAGHNPLLVNSGIWAKVKWQAIGIAIYEEYGLVWFGDIADETPFQKCKD